MTDHGPTVVHRIDSPWYAHDGRGPVLRRWLHTSDLLFAETLWENAADGLAGCQYHLSSSELAWVVFHGLQVIQVVPEEVHAYRYQELTDERGGAWRIEGSSWKAGFSQRHLRDHHHFVIELYDHIVEVIARELVFGSGAFDVAAVADDPRFCYAYLRRAQVREKAGELAAAIADFEAYAARTPEAGSARYAQRCAESLRQRLA